LLLAEVILLSLANKLVVPALGELVGLVVAVGEALLQGALVSNHLRVLVPGVQRPFRKLILEFTDRFQLLLMVAVSSVFVQVLAPDGLGLDLLVGLRHLDLGKDAAVVEGRLAVLLQASEAISAVGFCFPVGFGPLGSGHWPDVLAEVLLGPDRPSTRIQLAPFDELAPSSRTLRMLLVGLLDSLDEVFVLKGLCLQKRLRLILCLVVCMVPDELLLGFLRP